jgi:hypothetical protein
LFVEPFFGFVWALSVVRREEGVFFGANMGGRRDFRWGDAAEEDDGIEGVLPPTQVIGPDEKGVKIIIEWRKNEDGVRIKVTKTVRVKKQVGFDTGTSSKGFSLPFSMVFDGFLYHMYPSFGRRYALRAC